MPEPKELNAPEHYTALLDKYDTWMFDCDGVLWHGDALIDGATAVLDLLRRNSEAAAHTPHASQC